MVNKISSKIKKLIIKRVNACEGLHFKVTGAFLQ